MKKIGIFGWYHKGNFGDDLMANIVAKHVRDQGCEPLIWSLRPENNTEFNFPVVESFEEFIRESDAVIAGGGGWLVLPENAMLKSILEGVDQMASQLAKAVQAQDKPLVLISVGGSGHGSPESLSAPRRRLVEVAEEVTTRNRSDLPLLGDGGRGAAYFPDIVYQTKRFFPLEVKPPGRGGIGLVGNLFPDGKKKWLEDFWRDRVVGAENVCYIDTFSTSEPHEGMIVLKGIRSSLEQLAGFDAIVSGRLHAGMAASCYGVPSLVCNGEGKARIMMRENGTGRFSFHGLLGTMRLMLKLSSTSKRQRIGRAFFRRLAIGDLERASAGHLAAITRFVNAA